MTLLKSFLLGLCATNVIASPRNLHGRNQRRDASPGGGGGSGPPAYPHDGSWGPQSDKWDDGPSQYGGSWDHSTSDRPGPSYGGGGGGGWGHSSTCAASTIIETSTSTVLGPASTVYVSGSGYTTTLPASTVYISGSDHTVFIPASTLTIGGPAQTSVSTAFETITQPAAPTTIFVTRVGPGWNQTITREETDFITTTQREYSTIYNEETTTVTSAVTLPGIDVHKKIVCDVTASNHVQVLHPPFMRPRLAISQSLRSLLRQVCHLVNHWADTSCNLTLSSLLRPGVPRFKSGSVPRSLRANTSPGTTVTETSTERQTEYLTETETLPGKS